MLISGNMGAIRLARIAGIDIKLHPTFVLILLFGAWQWGSRQGAQGAIFGVVLTLAFFASVTLHELGHAFVARAFRIPVGDIILTPLGGIAQLNMLDIRPLHEGIIAIAGPLVNVLIVFGISFAIGNRYSEEVLRAAFLNATITAPTIETFWVLLLTANIVMAVFNLLPAFPLDGGRILRAVLAAMMGRNRATQIAVFIGRLFAVAFFVGGLYYNAFTLTLIGVFVFFAGGAELGAGQVYRALRHITAREAVNAYAPRFLPNTSRREALRTAFTTPISGFAVEHFGRFLGVVARDDLIRAEQLGEPDSYVTGLMRRNVPEIDGAASLESVRQVMIATGMPFTAVTSSGNFLGLITEQDLALQAALRSKKNSREGNGRVISEP